MPVTQANIKTITDAATGGVAATGTITITTNPANNDTVTVNGTVFTFKTSGAVGNQVNLGVDANATAAALQVVLAASTVAAVAKATYTVATNVVTVAYRVPGTIGNAFTLAKSGANHAVSGANLTSGSDAGATVYAPVPAGGTILEANEDSNFEKNLLAIVALVETTIQLSVDPSVNATKARGERKILKTLLANLAASISPVVAATDDRTVVATTVRTKALKRYNAKNGYRA